MMQRMQQSADGAPFAELLAFVAIAEELSFTRAGARLGRDPTVLSRRVRALEGRLGVRLLERTTRSVALTEAGRVYLARARGILLALAEADHEASGFGTGEPHGHLRIALPGTFGRLWLVKPVAEFLAVHPRVSIEAEFSNRFVDPVDERFDLAVRLGALTDSRLVARKIGERGRLLCASPDYLARAGIPHHADDLANHACLVFSGLPGGSRWELRDRGGTMARVSVSGPLVSDEVDALVEAALAGLGVLFATDWLVGHEIRAGRLVPVLPDWRVIDDGAIYIVTPSGSHHASKTRAFSDFIAACLRPPPWLSEDGTALATDPAR